MFQPIFPSIDLTCAGRGAYPCCRIPTIVRTVAGSLLCAYECRITPNDWDTRAAALRRSTDGGHTWSEQILAKHDTLAVNNPVLISCRDGRVIFLYQLNYLRTFVRVSCDDGLTFSAEREITAAFEDFRPQYEFNVCAVGPGHGIELTNGRLIVPVWLANNPQRHHWPSVSAVLISNDGGESWSGGEVIPASDTLPNPNETAAAQLSDGRVLFNLRHTGANHRRAVSLSANGVNGWSEPIFDEDLVDPTCFATLLALPKKNLLLYCGCADEQKRDHLTVKYTSLADPGQWTILGEISLHGGYSDIACSADENILYCFYERDNLSALTFSAWDISGLS